MKQSRRSLSAPGIFLLTLAIMTGCSDPQTLGRFRATPVTNVILPSLGVVDEEPELFGNARDPNLEDLRGDKQEYTINPGDTILINIMDLFQSGQEWVGQRQVNEVGRITLPEIGMVPAAGLTETGLTKAIVAKLSPAIILAPTVSVVVINSTVKTYSIDGAVAVPARYQLLNPSLRILEAFAEAGGIPQTGADYAYVIRTITMEPELATPPINLTPDIETTPAPPEITGTAETPAMESPAADQPAAAAPDSQPVAPPVIVPKSPTDPAIQKKEEVKPDPESELLESISPITRATATPVLPVNSVPPAILLAGDLPAGAVTGDYDLPAVPVAPGDIIFDFEENANAPQQLQVVIRIDLKTLQSGDLNQNIVIRPGDYIRVPFNATGVFYVMGQVTGPGPYQLRGEQMTLKQAMATVGGLTPLASPDRCDIIRRIGPDKEVTYKVNLRKLFEGTQPDIYLRPNDTINVGSHPASRWIAVIRNSFRYTYGFGFVYDRNLADKDFGN